MGYSSRANRKIGPLTVMYIFVTKEWGKFKLFQDTNKIKNDPPTECKDFPINGRHATDVCFLVFFAIFIIVLVNNFSI